MTDVQEHRRTSKERVSKSGKTAQLPGKCQWVEKKLFTFSSSMDMY